MLRMIVRTKDKLNDELVSNTWLYDVWFHQKNVSSVADIINKRRRSVQSSKCPGTLFITVSRTILMKK